MSDAETRPTGAHRPWPAPRKPWLMRMTWHDLLFAHWPVAPDVMRALIPGGVTLDTFDGQAWLGVVPFRMSNVRARCTPALPWLSAFPELNVRTYVTRDGRPGVWFFSLDAANPVAVAAARKFFHLPYFNARMSISAEQAGYAYESARTHRSARAAELRVRYRAIGPVYHAVPGALDDWLTARYCLYACDHRGGVYRCEIDHAPWPLQSAEAEWVVNSMAVPLGLAIPDTPPLLHFSRRLDVVAWWLDGPLDELRSRT